MHNELARIFIVSDCGLHLHSVVTIPELCETEAANCLQAVNLVKEVVMSAIMEGKTCPSKEIQLYSVLDSGSAINKAHILM